MFVLLVIFWVFKKKLIMFKDYLMSFINKLHDFSKTRSEMAEFGEKLVALKKFKYYIEDQTSFTLERKIYKDAYKKTLNEIKKELEEYLKTYDI